MAYLPRFEKHFEKEKIMNCVATFPPFENARMVDFEQGSEDRVKLVAAIERLRNDEPPLLPIWMNGMPFHIENDQCVCVSPHDIRRLLARYTQANEIDVNYAIDKVIMAKKAWEQMPWHSRLDIFRNAADLLQRKYFYDAVAVVMEDYSKNPFEAMIDVVELIDFWNYNVCEAAKIYQEQPSSGAYEFNVVDYRPWEGFIAAIPPNNFISIAMNLCSAPLIMGNVVVCKPAPETIFSFHFMLNILHEAGLPKDVLAVLHGDEEMIGNILLGSKYLSHVHFTGSKETMHKLVKTVGKNIGNYIGFPEVIGETGGKNFMLVYNDADPEEVVAAICSSAFGYQGRKCSALSRLYLTDKKWEQLRPLLLQMTKQMKIGDVADFRNYLGAIISEQEFKKIKGYIERALVSDATKEFNSNLIVAIANAKGYWIHPTIIVTRNPHSETMKDEIFGPVLTVYPMPQEEFEKRAIELCHHDEYALTGAIQTADAATFSRAANELRHAAGNLYNCRTTGAIVGRQPFGGSRKSGSNSKPGSKLNLYRWISPGCVSITHKKPKHFAPAYLDLVPSKEPPPEQETGKAAQDAAMKIGGF